MGEAVLSVVAGPIISSVVQDLLGSQAGGAAGAGGGPFDSLLKNFTSAFAGLFGNNTSSNDSTYSQVSNVMPFSTSDMSPASMYDPMAQIRPALNRFNQYGQGQVIVRDHRSFINSGSTGTGAAKDAADSAKLSSAQAKYDQAEQYAEDHPDDQNAQNNAQKAQLALQTLATRLSDENKMFANLALKADQNSILQV